MGYWAPERRLLLVPTGRLLPASCCNTLWLAGRVAALLYGLRVLAAVGLLGAAFAHLQRVLAGSRLYATTKTLGAREKVHWEINNMLRQRLGRVPDRWLFNYAHALVETRGFRRTQPLRFAVAVSAISTYASLRWNGDVSQHVLRTVTGWVIDNARITLRQVFTR